MKWLFCLSMAAVLLLGCSRQRTMHNMTIPAHQESLRITADHGYCVQAANGSVSMPPVHYVPTGGQTTTGNFTIYDQGRLVSGNYRSTTTNTPGDPFMAGMSKSAALGAMFSARRAQEDTYEGCMARFGWVDGERPASSLTAGKELNLPEAKAEETIQWQYLCASKANNRRYFGSPDAVLIDGDHRIFQVLHQRGEDEAVATVHIGDCSGKTIATTEVISMDIDTGETLYHVQYKPEEIKFLEPAPETVQETLLGFACSQN